MTPHIRNALQHIYLVTFESRSPLLTLRENSKQHLRAGTRTQSSGIVPKHAQGSSEVTTGIWDRDVSTGTWECGQRQDLRCVPVQGA